jgi:biopolymer transport protein ExbD
MGLQKRNKVSAEFNMSSLTDIIFLLLIFFMLTSTLVSPNALNLKLPGSNSKTVAPSTISVSVIVDGTFYVNKDQVAKENLQAFIVEELKKEKEPQKATIVINAELGTPIEHVVAIMDVARILKVGAILATEAQEQ